MTPFSTSQALSTDKEQPMYLEADSADIDRERGVHVYTGKVLVSQGTRRLWGNRMEVYMDANDDLERVIVYGKPARFKQLPDGDTQYRWGSALRIDYLEPKEIMVLTHQAKIWKGRELLSNPRIVYDSARDRMITGHKAKNVGPKTEASKQERVRITILPSAAKQARKNQPSLPDGAVPDHATPGEGTPHTQSRRSAGRMTLDMDIE